MQEFSFLSHLDWASLKAGCILQLFEKPYYLNTLWSPLNHLADTRMDKSLFCFFSAVLQCNGIWNRGGVHCSHILLRKVLIITGNFATVTWFPCTGSLQVVTLNWLTLNHFNLSKAGRVFFYVSLFLSEERTTKVFSLYKKSKQLVCHFFWNKNLRANKPGVR